MKSIGKPVKSEAMQPDQILCAKRGHFAVVGRYQLSHPRRHISERSVEHQGRRIGRVFLPHQRDELIGDWRVGNGMDRAVAHAGRLLSHVPGWVRARMSWDRRHAPRHHGPHDLGTHHGQRGPASMCIIGVDQLDAIDTDGFQLSHVGTGFVRRDGQIVATPGRRRVAPSTELERPTPK